MGVYLQYDNAMTQDFTRYVRRPVERELWGRAAGRCQFRNCHRLLYKSPVTQERVNLAEKAHIYSFSEHGPRGWGPFATNRKGLNDISNLMLVCHDCHEKIDQDLDGTRYPASLLIAWKREHEDRVRIVTGINPSRKSHVVLYGGKIGEESSPLQPDSAIAAMFPDWFPAEERPLTLSMRAEHEDTEELFWESEAAHLRAKFERHIVPRINEANPNHFSVFAFANQPLLILLGALFTDKVPAELYQLHREPVGWRWQIRTESFPFRTVVPEQRDGIPALVISLSAHIDPQRITSILGQDAAIWELTVEEPHNDFLKSADQLAAFRETARKLMVEITRAHGHQTPLNIFPAMPVACAVELGRIRMPKADMPWIVFDQNNKVGRFIKTLEIGGTS